MKPGLQFDGNPMVMTAATVPMLYLLVNRYSVETDFGFFAFILVAFLSLAALYFGLAPAFFPRVDHPLHGLDRCRWITGCGGCVLLFLFSLCSNGAVYAYMQLHPTVHMSLSEYTEERVANAGLVTLDAKLDLKRLGAAAHCSDCSASECARKDCRGELGLLLFSEHSLLRVDDIKGYDVPPPVIEDDTTNYENRRKLEDRLGGSTAERNTTNPGTGLAGEAPGPARGRRLSGAGAGGGGGGGGGGSSKKHCSITCVYAAPLLSEAADAADSQPLAWAISSSKPPAAEPGRVSGISKFQWWTGERRDYQRAMDEAVAHQLPDRLKACDGKQPVPPSKSWWGGCSSYGYVNCRTRDLAGMCCCPVGQRLTDSGCAFCGELPRRLDALHHLPLLYALPEDSGQYSFNFMMFLAVVLLPLPWSLAARVCWHIMDQARLQESWMRHEVRHQRKQIAETWIGASTLHGPWTIHVVGMTGDCRALPGFQATSLLVHLRRSIADVFRADFQTVGLVFGSELLPPDLDFQSLSDLGMSDGCSVSFVVSQVEPTPRTERMAGSSEGDAFAFFRRNRNVYRALQCHHFGQLRFVQGTVGNFGREYTKGWNCDGCERHFPPGTFLYRCDYCQIDFCRECAID